MARLQSEKPSAASVAYVRNCFIKANPVLAGRKLTRDESHALFEMLADAFDAGVLTERRVGRAQTITVSDRIGRTTFHADGQIEHHTGKGTNGPNAG